LYCKDSVRAHLRMLIRLILEIQGIRCLLIVPESNRVFYKLQRLLMEEDLQKLDFLAKDQQPRQMIIDIVEVV
jgi:hypothetical protein